VIGYLDCSTGVSGDKILGALIDAGFDPGLLRDALTRMGLDGVAVETSTTRSSGVTGAGVRVSETGAPRRDYRALRSLLEGAPVTARARTGALAALTALAEAEAHVHGVDVDDVHFHEIGAADTIVDLLGIAMGLDSLGIEHLAASPVAVGTGTVTTDHGELPVPAPAAAALLQGMPIVPGPAGGELTTPTGAAALRAFASEFGAVPPMVLRRVGTGCGTRDLGLPNVCRLLLGDPIVSTPESDEVVLLESNIDHLTPEELASAAERLREAGALDVWQTPIVMKKGRSATLLSALARPDDASRIADRMIAETRTLGVRVVPLERRLAERDVTEIDTAFGRARFKVATMPDGYRVLAVENDDASRIAAERGIAIDEASRLLESEAARELGVQPRRHRSPSDTTKPSD